MKINYTYEEAAEVLAIGVPTLKRNIRRYPHRGYGTSIRFSWDDLMAINEIHAVRPGQKAINLDEPAPLTAPAPQSLRDLKPSKASRKSA